MVKKYNSVLLLISLIIGLIHGLIISSFNVFLSWLLIGIWLILTIKIIKNTKRYREFNSPHNTAFFVVLPIFIAIFYTIWSNFTGLLVENLLTDSSLYLSWWSLVFGLPYAIYGSFSLHFCFRRYNVVYLGTKSVNGKRFGYIMIFLILFCIIFYWIVFYVANDIFEEYLSPINFSVDLILIFIFISTIFIMIMDGFLAKRRSLPELTREYITRRANRVDQITRPQPVRRPTRQRERVHTTERTRTSGPTRIDTRISRSSSRSSRTSPNRQTQTIRTSTRATTRRTTGKTKKTSKTKPSFTKIINLNKYKPKTTALSSEDFKCIFCFQLPKFPQDQGRGIILCPNCRYPAHADEFKDWLGSSKLCSRCNARIPTNYGRNPRIISIKNYILIYKDFLSKKR